MQKMWMILGLVTLGLTLCGAESKESEPSVRPAALLPETVEVRGQPVCGVEFQTKGTYYTVDGYVYFVQDLLSDTIILDIERFIKKDESESLPNFFTDYGVTDPRSTEVHAEVYINERNEIVYDLSAYRNYIKSELRKLYPAMAATAVDQLAREQFYVTCANGFTDNVKIYARGRMQIYKEIQIIVGVGKPYAKGMTLDLSGSDRFSSKPAARFEFYKTYYTATKEQKVTKSSIKVTYDKELESATGACMNNISLRSTLKISKYRNQKNNPMHFADMENVQVDALPLLLKVKDAFKGVCVLRPPQVTAINVVSDAKFKDLYWCIQGRYFGSTPSVLLEFKNKTGSAYKTAALTPYRGSNSKSTYLYHEDSKAKKVLFPVRVPSSAMLKAGDYPGEESVLFVKAPDYNDIKPYDVTDVDLIVNSGYASGSLENIYTLADKHRELCSKAEVAQVKVTFDGKYSYKYTADHFYARPLYRGQLVFQLVDSNNNGMLPFFYTDYETVSAANFHYQELAGLLQMVPLLTQKLTLRTRLRIFEVSEDMVIAQAVATENRQIVNPVAEQSGNNDIYLGEGGGHHLYIPEAKTKLRYVGEFAILP